MKIKHDSPIPKYMQIMEYVRQQIEAGAFKPNSRLPSERQLASQFSVNRLTVTKALKALEQEGLIQSSIGKGTYVSPSTKIDQNLETLSSFTEEMQAKQKTPSSQVLTAAIIGASEEVARALSVPPNTPVFSLKRLRLANGQILALEHSHVLYAVCTGILEGHDFSCESLYQVLAEDYGLRLTLAHQSVEARLPTPDEAKFLQIVPASPVLSFSRVTFSDEHTPIEYVQSVYPGDRYKLHITLK